MNIPGYDAWRLKGPDERPDPEMTACDQCDGSGVIYSPLISREPDRPCHVCGGSGEVPADDEEPDGDYEYERRRDAMT